LIADFSKDFTDDLDNIFTKNISRMMRDEFVSGEYSSVVVFYNYYVNTIKQIATAKITLPISSDDIKKYLLDVLGDDFDLEAEMKKVEDVYYYEIEPSEEEVAKEVIPFILDMMFYDVLLDAKASEHSARMIAMKNAKDSANKIASNLTLKYNKARQAMITREVSEITS